MLVPCLSVCQTSSMRCSRFCSSSKAGVACGVMLARMPAPDGRHWREVGLDELVDIELSDDERNLLWQGLLQWGGPSCATDAVAEVIGFANVDSMFADTRRLRDALRARGPLSKRDLQRLLIATEIGWASNFYGAGTDWEPCSGWDDQKTLVVLRQLQRRLAGLSAERRPRGPRAERPGGDSGS